MIGPYATAADLYWQAGWRGILPLPPRRKHWPPTGYTGERGLWPSYPDVHAWATGPEGDGNIGLRLPPHILGVDIDNYDGKPGQATLEQAEKEHGALPPTWRSTSRDDGVSGIRLYRIPEGLRWPGTLGAGTELIQYRHRYAVVWPSVHPEGRTYRWISPEGVVSTAIPDPDRLPAMPDAWVEGLTGGEAATDTPSNDYGDDEIRQWIVTRKGATDDPCARMRTAADATLGDLRGAGSAHEAALGGVMRIVRLADEGHAGLVPALADIHQAFIADITRTGRPGAARTAREAEAEWHRLVKGAVNKVSASSAGFDACDCSGALTGLIVSGAYPVAGSAALTPLPDPTSHDQPEPDSPDRERTSWYRKDLTGILTGHDQEPQPTHLARADGQCLFYAGKVNAVLGESESGKTWIAMLAVAQAFTAGGHVVYLDFEDTATGIVNRLRLLGCDDNHIAYDLTYIGPDETFHATAAEDLRDVLDQTQPDLIVVDGVNAAMTLLGLDINSNNDATKFAQLLLKPLSRSDAAVIAVDHVPKRKEDRGKGGIGAQAKRAMMTGCAILVDVVEPFGRGMTGKLRLSVDKDRAGYVRGNSANARFAGTAILTSDAETGSVTIAIQPPDMASRAQQERGQEALLMERISEYLLTNPERSSVRGIRAAVPGNDAAINAALEQLVLRGYVERTEGPRGYQHRIVREYTIAADLAEDRGRPWPDRGHETGHPNGVTVAEPPTVPPKGGPGFRPRSGVATNHTNQNQDHGHGPGHGPIPEADMWINPVTGEILDPEADR